MLTVMRSKYAPEQALVSPVGLLRSPRGERRILPICSLIAPQVRLCRSLGFCKQNSHLRP